MRNLHKTRLRDLLLSTLALPLIVVDTAWAQESPALPAASTGVSSETAPAGADMSGPDAPTGDPEPSSALSGDELAKEISNPVTSLWQLQFQFNNVQLESSETPVSEEWVNNLYFQPVMPLSLTDNWNLITRPVISLYNSVPYPTGPTAATGERPSATPSWRRWLRRPAPSRGSGVWARRSYFRLLRRTLLDRASGRSGLQPAAATSPTSS